MANDKDSGNNEFGEVFKIKENITFAHGGKCNSEKIDWMILDFENFERFEETDCTLRFNTFDSAVPKDG
jgi:hypothetical protein